MRPQNIPAIIITGFFHLSGGKINVYKSLSPILQKYTKFTQKQDFVNNFTLFIDTLNKNSENNNLKK